MEGPAETISWVVLLRGITRLEELPTQTSISYLKVFLLRGRITFQNKLVFFFISRLELLKSGIKHGSLFSAESYIFTTNRNTTEDLCSSPNWVQHHDSSRVDVWSEVVEKARTQNTLHHTATHLLELKHFSRHRTKQRPETSGGGFVTLCQ